MNYYKISFVSQIVLDFLEKIQQLTFATDFLVSTKHTSAVCQLFRCVSILTHMQDDMKQRRAERLPVVRCPLPAGDLVPFLQLGVQQETQQANGLFLYQTGAKNAQERLRFPSFKRKFMR